MANGHGTAFRRTEPLSDTMISMSSSASADAQAHPAQISSKSTLSLSLSESIVSGLVRFFDAFLLACASLVVYLIYVDAGQSNLQLYLSATAIYVALTVGVFQYAGLYDFNTIAAWPTRMRHMLALVSLVALVLVAFAFALKISQEFSRVWFFSAVILSSTLIGASRGVCRAIMQRMAREGVLVHNVAIVGAGGQAEHLISELNHAGAPWKRVIGLFDDRKTRITPEIGGLPVIGDLDDLVHYVRMGKVHDVVITLPWSADRRLVGIIRRLRALPVHIFLGADLIGYHFPRHRQEFIVGVPVMHIATAPLTGWSGLVKLFEDKCVAGIVLTLFAPIMLLVALAIKLESPGPIFFRQKRYGFNNKLIEVWKFRSMYHHLRDEDASTLATRGDSRITRVGAFIRRTSLDELPQLINVLKGDMSIVGPRPHALKAKAGGRLYQEVVSEYAVRHKVKPGLTGWAQVNGWRGETEVEEQIIRRVEYDLYYIENWSLWLDIKILLLTAVCGWTGQKAY